MWGFIKRLFSRKKVEEVPTTPPTPCMVYFIYPDVVPQRRKPPVADFIKEQQEAYRKAELRRQYIEWRDNCHQLFGRTA